jgi:hypothetical protein
MEINLIKYEKDNFALFKVGAREEQVYLVDYDMTDGSKLSLESVFFPYQVEHIAKTLKEKMLDSEYEKNKNGQQEGKGEKVSHYVGENGKDLIDQWHEEYPIEIFRILMFEQMRKYNTRLGKKDDIKKEVGKIANYANRWLDKEATK